MAVPGNAWCTVDTEVMTILWTFVALGGVVLLAVVSAGAALAAVAVEADREGLLDAD